jgi:DNA-binding transcriptional ArsR family regulator
MPSPDKVFLFTGPEFHNLPLAGGNAVKDMATEHGTETRYKRIEHQTRRTVEEIFPVGCQIESCSLRELAEAIEVLRGRIGAIAVIQHRLTNKERSDFAPSIKEVLQILKEADVDPQIAGFLHNETREQFIRELADGHTDRHGRRIPGQPWRPLSESAYQTQAQCLSEIGNRGHFTNEVVMHHRTDTHHTRALKEWHGISVEQLDQKRAYRIGEALWGGKVKVAAGTPFKVDNGKNRSDLLNFAPGISLSSFEFQGATIPVQRDFRTGEPLKVKWRPFHRYS